MADVIDAAIERLKAEQERRLAEKVEKGDAVTVPAPWLVIGGPDRSEAVVAEFRVAEEAKLRAAGDMRPLHFEEPTS